MNSNLITDIGENLEYIKTIVVNELEIKKLDFVDSGANIVSKIVSSALIFLFLFRLFQINLFLVMGRGGRMYRENT